MARITFLLPPLSLNGGIRVVGEYGRALLRQGHEVAVVARRPARARLRDILRGRAPLFPRREDPSDFFGGLEDRLRFFPAGRALRPEDLPDADFLICTWWETVEWALTMPAAKGRLAHLMQGYEMLPGQPPDRVARTYEAETVKIAVSDWVADQVLKHHGRASAAVIHNAVDTARFAFAAGPAGPQPVLGFVYSQPPFKNSALAFALADRLAAQGSPVRLVSLGSDPMPAELAGRPDTVFHHRPDQSTIPGLYQSCDLWLFPSLEEGFGLPLLEAMACGTPVVSGHAGAAPQLVQTGRNGWLTEPTAGDFAAAVARHMALPAAEKAAMRRAARATVENWNWDAAAGRLAETLRA